MADAGNVGSPLGRKIVANSAVQMVGALVASTVSYFTFVIVARQLGPSAFGDMTAALVYLFIPAVLADVGLTATIVRRISAHPEDTERELGTSFPLRAIIAVGITLLFVAAAFVLPFSDRARVGVLIACFGTFATLLTAALLPVFQARLLMQWPVAATVAGRIVTLGLTYVVVATGGGFKSFIWAAVAGQAATFLILAGVLRFVIRLRLRPRVDLPVWKKLIRDGAVLGGALAIGQL